ncbi:hypothetical protein [Micromonospora zhanjiangensis]|uniref:Uncharacterized protein n=1 Tax=Micromonospora zhanjiangensis TaxID=1522057 RepID=A0ABV8KP15_9ACTN
MRRIPTWLGLAIAQAVILATVLLGGLIAYQGDRLGRLPSTAVTEPASERPITWRWESRR